jgi:F-type H+-transporting ATPase subunit delta
MLDVTVTSAIELTSKQMESIKKAVEEKYDQKINYIDVVDPSVIGGVSIRIGSEERNATIKHKLEQIRSQVLTNT